MLEQHPREEILEAVDTSTFAVVATFDGSIIRTRSMHLAHDDNFNFYFASMKDDPKIRQMEANTKVSVWVFKKADDEIDSGEVEITGRASIVADEEERQELFKKIAINSSIVKSVMEGGATSILHVIKITPITVRYRVFREIIRGVPPTVMEFEPVAAASALRQEQGSWTSTTEKMRRWLEEVRAPFLTAAIIPVLLGSTIAWAMTGAFHWGYFLLTLLGGVFLQAGTNVANDYYDHLSQNDEINTEYVRPFSGGSRVIQKGLMSPRAVLTEALVFFGLGIIIGLYLAWARGPFILLLGIIGVFSGFFYTAPPFKLANRGIGELVVGANFGILMSLGAFYVQTQALAWQPLIAAIPVSLLIAAVLYINEFPDHAADKAVGKNHLVVRLGKARAVPGYVALMLAPYAVIAMGVFAGLVPASYPLGLPVFALIGFLTLPRALGAVRVARKYYGESVYLVPANASTILVHLYTGLLLAGGFILDRGAQYLLSYLA